MILLLVAGAGVVVGTAISLLARRWPQIEAPRLAPATVVGEVDRHPKLADHLRRHFNPKTETGLALTIATGVVVGAAVGIGLVLAMVREHRGLSSWDVRLARYGAEHATPTATSVMRDISLIGGTSGVIVIATVACVIELIRRPSKAVPAFLIAVVAGQFALSNGIKYLVDRARPNFDRLTGFSGTSFPSGHSTASAATLAAVALVLTRGRSRRAKIAAAGIAGGVAAMVASTRVFLGVHWFTDVVAGLLLGWGWFALVSMAFGGRLLIFGEPVKEGEAAAEVLT